MLAALDEVAHLGGAAVAGQRVGLGEARRLGGHLVLAPLRVVGLVAVGEHTAAVDHRGVHRIGVDRVIVAVGGAVLRGAVLRGAVLRATVLGGGVGAAIVTLARQRECSDGAEDEDEVAQS